METSIISDRSKTTLISQRAQHSPQLKRPWKWPYVLLSFFLGTLLWTAIDLKRMEETPMEVDLVLDRQIPADWRFIDPPPQTVIISIRGTRQDMGNLRKENIMVEPELPPGALGGDIYEGMLTLHPNQVRGLPAGIEVKAVTPEVIPIRLSKIMTKYVTVEAGKIVGEPAPGYIIGKVNPPDPPAMPVIGPKSFLDKIGPSDVIHTKDFSVEGAKSLTGGMVELLPFEKDGVKVDVPGRVYLTVELQETPITRELEDPLEVRVLVSAPFNKFSDISLSPPVVKLTVAGPQSAIDKLSPNDVTVYVDMRDRVPTSPGEFNFKCKALTPSRVHVVKINPDTVKWATKEESQPAAPTATATAPGTAAAGAAEETPSAH